jgi:hypothetical protein
MKTYRQFKEEIGNTAGSGAIAGIGVGPQGEPGVNVKDDELRSSSLAAKTPVWPMMKRKKPTGLDEDVKLNPAELNILDLFVTETLFLKGANVGKVKRRISGEQVKWRALESLLDKKMIDHQVNTNLGDGYAATPLGFAYWKKSKQLKEDLFAGAEVFDVSPEVFSNCRLGKLRYHRWARYVGDDMIGQKIRAYGVANPNKSIVIRDKRTGAMMFLRHATLPSFASFC